MLKHPLTHTNIEGNDSPALLLTITSTDPAWPGFVLDEHKYKHTHHGACECQLLVSNHAQPQRHEAMNLEGVEHLAQTPASRYRVDAADHDLKALLHLNLSPFLN